MSGTIHADVAIVGAGATGCLLGLALGRAGLRVAILERSEHLPFNGGEFLKPSGLRVLRRYALEAPILKAALRRQHIRYFHDGEELFTYDYAEHTGIGYYLIAPHAEIMNAILGGIARLDSVDIHMGVGDATPRWEGEQVVAVDLERGGDVRAPVVIGADGKHSGVRRSMGMTEEPRPSELEVYMTSIPAVPSIAALNRLYLSSTEMAIYFYPVSRELARVGVSMPIADAGEVFPEGAGAEAMIERARAIVSESDDALAAMVPGQRFIRLPISEMHASRYVRGNVAILGDAAHCGHPITGQGMNQAFLDASVLADALIAWHRGELSSSEALARYETERRGENRRLFNYSIELAGCLGDRARFLECFDFRLHGWDPPGT